MVQLENGLYASFYRGMLSMFSNKLINNRLYSNLNEYIKYNTQFYDFNMHFFLSFFICLFSTGLLTTVLFLLKITYLYLRNDHQAKFKDSLVLKTNYLKNKNNKINNNKILFKRPIKNHFVNVSTRYYYY